MVTSHKICDRETLYGDLCSQCVLYTVELNCEFQRKRNNPKRFILTLIITQMSWLVSILFLNKKHKGWKLSGTRGLPTTSLSGLIPRGLWVSSLGEGLSKAKMALV